MAKTSDSIEKELERKVQERLRSIPAEKLALISKDLEKAADLGLKDIILSATNAANVSELENVLSSGDKAALFDFGKSNVPDFGQKLDELLDKIAQAATQSLLEVSEVSPYGN